MLYFSKDLLSDSISYFKSVIELSLNTASKQALAFDLSLWIVFGSLLIKSAARLDRKEEIACAQLQIEEFDQQQYAIFFVWFSRGVLGSHIHILFTHRRHSVVHR